MGYYDDEMKEALVGEALLAYKVEDGGSILKLRTTKGVHIIRAEGDCCARSYIQDVNSLATLPARITNVESKGFKRLRKEEYGDVTDQEFITFATSTGYIDVELRTEHNGYYGGYLVYESFTTNE